MHNLGATFPDDNGETLAGLNSAEGVMVRPILLQKYGGSSVATVEHLRKVARRIVQEKRQGKAMVVVVSAMGKTTDELVARSREISANPPRREMDMLLHAGEIISAALLAMAIQEAGEPAVSFTGSQAGMITDASHTQARIQDVQAERVLEELGRGRVVVITGFQGTTPDREVTTLGRGGSDTSAVAFAVGIQAERCEILTDVEGVYTADPRIVKGSRKIAWCSYDEMLELTTLGARVLHSRSVEIARRFGMPILVASSFTEAPGTLICSRELFEKREEREKPEKPEKPEKEVGEMEEVSIRGVAHNRNVAKISLVGVPDRPGVAAKVFETLAREDVNILLIVQAEHHEGTNDITFLIAQDMLPRVRQGLDALAVQVEARSFVIDEALGTVSLVGEGVWREPGIAARMFSALARAGINIDLISTSNLTITCVVARDRIDDGVQAVHAEFLEERKDA